jgi:hypothetical protein
MPSEMKTERTTPFGERMTPFGVEKKRAQQKLELELNSKLGPGPVAQSTDEFEQFVTLVNDKDALRNALSSLKQPFNTPSIKLPSIPQNMK